MLNFYVAFLRALYEIHQDNHWKSHGNDFYGNHLLFQRLYEDTQDHVDTAAEKALGVYQELDTNPELIAEIVEKFNPDKFDGNLLESSLAAEQEFLDMSRKLYFELQKSDDMTLGVDDMIMSISNDHESHVYLLQQALKD